MPLSSCPRGAGPPRPWCSGRHGPSATARCSQDAHAALVLRPLGPTERLLWYVPGVSDLALPDLPAGTSRTRAAGSPSGPPRRPGCCAAAVIAFALARGRRLGRLVVEPCPSSSARARPPRPGAGSTTGPRTGRSRRASCASAAGPASPTASASHARHPSSSLVDAATRASGVPRSDVEQLLDGPDPTTDRDLLLLSQAAVRPRGERAKRMSQTPEPQTREADAIVQTSPDAVPVASRDAMPYAVRDVSSDASDAAADALDAVRAEVAKAVVGQDAAVSAPRRAPGPRPRAARGRARASPRRCSCAALAAALDARRSSASSSRPT